MSFPYFSQIGYILYKSNISLYRLLESIGG